MIVVVSDTSPIRAMAALNLLQILPRLFDQILVPPTVVSELAVDVPGLGPIDVPSFHFLRVVTPSQSRSEHKVPATLDAGERQAIALALEQCADLLLVDDGPARAVATKNGLTVIGSLGILVRAKEVGLVERVTPLMDRLMNQKEIRFRVSEAVRQEVLRLADEAPEEPMG